MKQDMLPIRNEDPVKVCVVCHREVKPEDEYGPNYEIKSIDNYRWRLHNGCYNLLITIFKIQLNELGDDLMNSVYGMFDGSKWHKEHIGFIRKKKQEEEAKQT